ncbi:MAG: AAA family ATPase [Pyrinomonadaceae bacterium]
MLLTIPILATEQKQANQPAPSVVVRPLFNLNTTAQGNNLQKAVNKLRQKIREQFVEHGKKPRHYDLAWFTFSPLLTTKVLNFRLFLSSGTYDCCYIFVTFNAFGKKVVFSPNLSGVWFELERGEDLHTRAVEVFTEHFRHLERRDGKGVHNPANHTFSGRAFVTSLDLNIQLPQKHEAEKANLFALLGGDAELDGRNELRRVGRNLDALYPDDLERAIGRSVELRELTRLLNSPDKRPVVIVGSNQVGKTNLIHEYVFQTLKRRKNKGSGKKLTWLISPQRLISGMSFVGQWENRLIAILKTAQKLEHLLYFDDLLGLHFAGISAGSDLNVAQVLKPHLERRDVRALGEITPETFRVLKEKDRGFAELFHVFRLRETNDDETLRIAMAVRREAEHRFNTSFALDVLPTALDLQRRYNREVSFPGKAAGFLKQISNKFQNREITRGDVLREFEAKSGLRVAFLDDGEKLEKTEITQKISAGLIGQKPAVEAAADVISVAKARLNDPGRPLASFLFLGATGVGKTEAAKQIADYLYGDEEKLLRFDMNEFVSPFDVARLVGTFDQPEGLLTGAIRRQPFSVVLLDEIEKAHPDVFNLLLQVLGEGRLTDAFGRTSDFSNAIIILTSNLGTREANIKLGFRETNESNASIYRQAAEKFFRPEFFNRLDKIIPFENLSREEVGRIARLQLQRVFAREGFARRNCRIELEPSALERIVDEGYNPELGARALKRAIERNLIQPVAVRLAALETSVPILIKISRSEDDFHTQVEEIKPFAPEKSVWQTGDFSDVHGQIDRIEDVLDRIEAEVEGLRPPGEIDPEDPAQAKFFLIREYVKRIERMIERADNWRETPTQNRPPKTRKDSRRIVTLSGTEIDLNRFLAGTNLSNKIKNLALENPDFGEAAADYVQDIWRETALLQILVENVEKPLDSRCLLVFRSADVYFGRENIPPLIETYRRLLAGELGLKAEIPQPNELPGDYFQVFLRLEGLFAADLIRGETGNHVFVNKRGDFTAVELDVLELPETAGSGDLPKLYEGHQRQKVENDFSVVRISNERGTVLDFRSGLITREDLTFRELRTFILAGLPMPAEFFS